MSWTYTAKIFLPSSYAGITDWQAQLYDASGAATGSPVTAGFAAMTGGSYQWTRSLADGFRGSVAFSSPARSASPLAWAAVTDADELGQPLHAGTARAWTGTLVSAATLQLADTASTSPGAYLGNVIEITSGNLAGQQYVITAYNAVTQTVTLARSWFALPDSSTPSYRILRDISPGLSAGANVSLVAPQRDVHTTAVIDAVSGDLRTLTLSTGSSVDGSYLGQIVRAVSGANAVRGFSATVTAYTGSTRELTLADPLPVSPTLGVDQVSIAFARALTAPTAAEVSSAVWAAGSRTLTSYGSLVADVASAVWSAVSRTLTANPGPTSSEIATAVWAAGSRTLTGFGSLVSDVVASVWGAATRTLTANPGPSTGDISSAVDATLSTAHGSGDWRAATVVTRIDSGVGLTSGERTTLVSAIWAAGTRTLTSYGSLVADTVAGVWAAATRTITGPVTLASGQATAIANEVAASLDGVAVTIVSPVLRDKRIELVEGDDYRQADGRALTWTLTGAVPDLTGATIQLVAGRADNETIEWGPQSGTVVTGSGASKVVRVELTATQTTGLDEGRYQYQLRAVLATSANNVTLVAGPLDVVRRVRP